jgi:hypothetical protein
MLFIFLTLAGVALLSPIVALRFVIARWFVPATLAEREEAAGGRGAMQLGERFVLSALD